MILLFFFNSYLLAEIYDIKNKESELFIGFSMEFPLLEFFNGVIVSFLEVSCLLGRRDVGETFDI